MLYAPVIIPTLNRYKHLKECIESLAKNTGAKHTDLIISLDYPKTESHWQGYRKVQKYLHSGIQGFQSVKIFEQNVNLGAFGNWCFLKKYVRENYDRYIVTEDDNVFSLNFLDFINKGLERYEKDDNITAVCAAGPRLQGRDALKNRNTITKSHWFSGYGYGTWVGKSFVDQDWLDVEELFSMSENITYVNKIYQADDGLFLAFVSFLFAKEGIYRPQKGKIYNFDTIMKMKSIYENKYAIFPTTTLVVNNGYDGTGVNCTVVRKKSSPDVLDNNTVYKYSIKHGLAVCKVKSKFRLHIKARKLAAYIQYLSWLFRRHSNALHKSRKKL